MARNNIQDKYYEKNSNLFIPGLILGAIIGVGLGLILSPSSGQENKKLFKEKKNEFEKKAKPLIADAKEVLKTVNEVSRPIRKEIEKKLDGIKSNHTG